MTTFTKFAAFLRARQPLAPSLRKLTNKIAERHLITDDAQKQYIAVAIIAEVMSNRPTSTDIRALACAEHRMLAMLALDLNLNNPKIHDAYGYAVILRDSLRGNLRSIYLLTRGG